MRYLAAAIIATIGLGACTESARRALGPVGDINGRDVALIPADTIIYCTPRSCALPTRISRSEPRATTKPSGPLNGPSVVMMSWVIDTSGFVIRNSVRIANDDGGETADAFRDWIRESRFEPVRRGGRPVRAAIRNVEFVFQVRR
jgi:hypothetical protein